MDKLDFKKDQKELYSPGKDFRLVTVPPMQFLEADGHGNPNTSEWYGQVIEALYSVSYTLKFASKKQFARDYVVGPLEGLWWAKDMSAFTRRAKDEWSWTLMIRQPDWLRADHIKDAMQQAAAKKELPAVDSLRLGSLDEGLSVQIMHVGPYDDEGPVLARLHDEYLPANKLEPVGRHHEIYLSDARKTEPSKLKTILRQPVRRT
ncbi:GyrI-like domain-containing protein [Arthrobacter sulfonylureivorans]|uniref:GyrI-like domain-containing protein n=1 Tax=Arthrobacter sulfonylureivorans TaxID=2486855 RepID=A0ABY3WC31_9MICC|nr:GyrI-like domain-containing protein [Arthrobacter sulfonylureivorans]UNK45289.1 GyrI-like domain-containing protein [Arthrobacter sulfonylureivorans]